MTTGPVAIRRLVFLVGFMGCGKTTVGRSLASRLGWKFIDLDERIEQRLGRSIAQVFADQGEPFFRQTESAVLGAVLAEAERSPTVVALGGGTIAQAHNFARIRTNGGISIWLRCPPEELWRRCGTMMNRPLFRDLASFQELYRQRLPDYEQADFAINVTGRTPGLVVESILALAVF